MYKYWIIVRTLLIEEMTNKNKEFITNKSNVCNYEYMVEDKMVIEYLPILEQKDNKILTIGKIDRTKAHTNPPVLHATSIIVAVLFGFTRNGSWRSQPSGSISAPTRPTTPVSAMV